MDGFIIAKSWQFSLMILNVLFLKCLLCQCRDFFCAQCHIVNANIVNQAEPIDFPLTWRRRWLIWYAYQIAEARVRGESVLIKV
jgi:hypothetical protein